MFDQYPSDSSLNIRILVNCCVFCPLNIADGKQSGAKVIASTDWMLVKTVLVPPVGKTDSRHLT